MAFQNKKAASIAQINSAKELFVEGANLEELGRYEEAVQVYDELLARFGELAGPALQGLLAKALVNKARIILGVFDRREEALTMYEDALSKLGTGVTQELLGVTAITLGGKRSTLMTLGRNAEALAVCDEVVQRFGAMR